MIYVVDRVAYETFEVYGEIGFRRYYRMSAKEACRCYRREIRRGVR